MNERDRGGLRTVLTAIFVLALLMGPGPGLYLVNPDTGDPEPTVALLGVPVLYLWCLFWSLVQAGVVLVAYVVLWNDTEEAG